MDVHRPEQRSRNMSRIRGRDTKPEMLLRRGLHAAGLRFRLQAKDLPGRPDLVFPCDVGSGLTDKAGCDQPPTAK